MSNQNGLDEMLEQKMIMKAINSANDKCWNKCVVRVNDPLLSPGEQECLKKCVTKYFAVQFMLQETFIKQVGLEGSSPPPPK